MGTIGSSSDALVQEYLKKYATRVQSMASSSGHYSSNVGERATDQVMSKLANVGATTKTGTSGASWHAADGVVKFSSGSAGTGGDVYSKVMENLQGKVASGELKKYNGSQALLNDYLGNYNLQIADVNAAYKNIANAQYGYRNPSNYYVMYGVAQPTDGGSWSYVSPDGTYGWGYGWGGGTAALYGPYPISNIPTPTPIVENQNINTTVLYGPYPISNIPTPVVDNQKNNIALYGVFTPNPNKNGKQEVTISITEEEIKENVSILKKAANTMENAWEEIKGPIIKAIKEAWTSKECEEYVSKIEKMDRKVTNSIEALRLLAKTYEQSLEQLTATAASIKTAISNI